MAGQRNRGVGGGKCIAAGPVPALDLLVGAIWPPPPPLDQGTLSFWYNARVAIYQGVRQLGLGPGDRVLAPAYACGAELDALLRAGLHLDLYRHRPDLSPDLDHLAALCTRATRLLYVTHYFGFSQPMASLLALAREYGLLVMEDCAPALYSRYPDGTPVGTLGDAAVFSLTKSVPLPDGGVLRLNRPAAAAAAGAIRPAWLAVAGKCRYLVEAAAARRRPRLTRAVKARINDPVVRWLKARQREGGPSTVPGSGAPDPMAILQLPPERVAWGMSPIARHLWRRLPHGPIGERRRANYRHLAARLPAGHGYRPLLGPLPDHCVPWTFPLLVDDPLSFHRYCLAHGVATTPTWTYFHTALPLDRFPAESHLKTHVVSVPIHQDMGEPEMEAIAAVIGGWGG